MLSLEEALETLLKSIKPIERDEQVPLSAAVGRFLAQEVRAPNRLPLFDNSAMDGWAVRAADVASASADRPVPLRSIASIPAGQFFTGKIEAGECIRIFTGSPLPAGADAIVMQEDT